MRLKPPNIIGSPRKTAMLCCCLSLLALSKPGISAVRSKIKAQTRFQYDITSFHSDLNIPLIVNNKPVPISDKNIRERLDRYPRDERIEPLQLTVEGQDDKIMDLAGKIAEKSHKLELANYLKTNFLHGEEIPGSELRLVTLDKAAYAMINQEAFEGLFRKNHRELFIPASALNRNTQIRQSLITQLNPFLRTENLANIRRKLAKNQNLSMDLDLLPEFARANVAKHSTFRGPNCFHAALSFQGADIASSYNVNVRQEPGYHRDMINYDELWRVLQLSFYEINPEKVPIQYGDMIVFFETKTPQYGSLDFKTLRHAATYLLGGYVFSKGSKSANSPYLVRTLADEWETWTKYTDKLGAKVFRRSLKHVTNPAPEDPVDWVY